MYVCFVYSYIYIYISTLSDGVLQPNFDGSKFSVSDTNSSSAGLKERLHIENVGVADEGNYTCQEFQQPGTASLHIFDVFILSKCIEGTPTDSLLCLSK